MKDIKNNSISKVYLFYGEEFLLSQMLLKNLKKSFISPQYEQLNVTSFDGKTVTVDEIINACETLPFIESKRLVVVNNISVLHGTNSISSKDIDALCNYIGNLPPSSCLVFINKDIDKKRKLYKAILKYGEVVEYNKLSKIDLSRWITKRTHLRKKKIENNALNFFIESSDYLNRDSKMNLSDIENDIEKILAFSKDKAVIELNDIESSIQENTDTNIFKMLELLGKGSISQSLSLLDILIKNGEPPVKILFMIVRQIRLIYHSKLLMDAGYSTNDISKIMGERPFVVTKALNQVKLFSYEKLNAIYEYAAKIDIKMKSTQLDHKLALEMLLVIAN
nr:DNA polymerase III subunit delta [Alkalibaculum sporogenes]